MSISAGEAMFWSDVLGPSQRRQTGKKKESGCPHFLSLEKRKKVGVHTSCPSSEKDKKWVSTLRCPRFSTLLPILPSFSRFISASGIGGALSSSRVPGLEQQPPNDVIFHA
jgi:hypothetical protein